MLKIWPAWPYDPGLAIVHVLYRANSKCEPIYVKMRFPRLGLLHAKAGFCVTAAISNKNNFISKMDRALTCLVARALDSIPWSRDPRQPRQRHAVDQLNN